MPGSKALPARAPKLALRERLANASARGKELDPADAAFVERCSVLRRLRGEGRTFAECARELGISETQLKTLERSRDYADVAAWQDGTAVEETRREATSALAKARVEIELLAGREVPSYYRLCLAKDAEGKFIEPGLAQWAIEKLAKAGALDQPANAREQSAPIPGTVINIFMGQVQEDDDENERLSRALDITDEITEHTTGADT